jgi:hypothetical protein
MQIPAFKISPLILFATVTVVAIGQLVCGTGLYYTAMMALTMFFIGVAYNLLGGVSTMSGLAFAVMALRLVVISQIAKIAVFQPAEKYMVNPDLTVTVYAVFFACAMVGVFTYQGVRVPLPRPKEPQSNAQLTILYAFAMPLGIVGTIIFNLNNVAYGDKDTGQNNQEHSLGLAMSALLLFSIVVAIDRRLRKTDGRHSFGFLAFVPWIVGTLSGFINTQREAILAPTIIYFITCYFRGYRMRRRHYIVAACGVLLFILVVSPIALYTRGAVENGQYRDRIVLAYNVITTANWKEVIAGTSAISSSDQAAAEDYYNLPGTKVLNRLSRIRMDSNLIGACVGFHYGFEALNQDLLHEIPHILDKKKPEYNSGDYLGRVSGVSTAKGNTQPAFTMVGDSFGAFGWFGVVAVALIVLPLTFRVYESMFDMSQPWGTVAMVSLVLLLPEGGVGRLVAQLLLRGPIFLVVGSYVIATLVGMVPVTGDSARRGIPRHSLGPRSAVQVD